PLLWKPRGGPPRLAAAAPRTVSDPAVSGGCHSPVSTPLYRLVQFQLERDVRQGDQLPASLQQGRILSAVYRFSPAAPSKPQGIALRLMVDPKRAAATPACANIAQVLAS